MLNCFRRMRKFYFCENIYLFIYLFIYVINPRENKVEINK